MNKPCVFFAIFAVATLTVWARGTEADQRPSLVPAPMEVQLRQGGFRVGPATKIVVEFGHQSEDRIAAETLSEEISDQSGLALDIVGAKAGGKAEGGTIVLARLQDRRVRRFLASKGLKVDESVGEQGYVLFSDESHLIVAANSGQGLFYGVQTLRQLLRAEGKDLVCPAVTIRDWPSLQRHGAPDNVSRGTIPEFPHFRSPGA